MILLPSSHDYSYVWRPAIENHEQNHSYGGIRDALVVALRDALERVAGREPQLVARFVQMLEQHRWIVFYRLALHILVRFPTVALDLFVDRATDSWRFDDHRVRHEFGQLLRQRFGLLPEASQTAILARIDAGPELELQRFRERTEEMHGHAPTDEEVQKYAKHWRLERLALIGEEQLPPAWRERYREWSAELGAPQHPDFPVYSTGMLHGPTSVKTADELKEMSINATVSFLARWEPSEGWMGPSREGLGRALAETVSAEPARFAEAAAVFKGLHPTYVRELLRGLRDAAKDKTFPWVPVLELCQWVTEQHDNASPSALSDTDDGDPDWSWSRRAAADLLDKGLTSEESEVPIALRRQVWRVLEPLTSDPEPSPDYEARYGGTNMDASTLSINTIRGAAMHAVMRYVLWVRRHAPLQTQTRGLAEIPEALAVLEQHLDPLAEPSLAIRSVYGRWLPWLVTWDPAWTSEWLTRILPRPAELTDFRDIAWEAYVVFSPAYSNVFEVLRHEYSIAVDRIGPQPNRRHLADPTEKLGEHVVTLYWRGLISLGDGADLLPRFFEKAPPAARAHVLRFVGISLQNTEGDIPDDVRERLQRLWSWRIEQLRGKDLSEPEIAEFGWWYSSAKFDESWALDQLSLAVQLAGRVEPEHQVLERLASVAVQSPRQTIDVLSAMIKQGREPWRVLGWSDEIRKVLTAVLATGEAKASEMAVDLIQSLGARGIRDYANLLPPTS